MREDQNDLMLAQARSGLTGGLRLANARDAKNARDLDAEMRKRRLARNALLAVRWTEGGGGGSTRNRLWRKGKTPSRNKTFSGGDACYDIEWLYHFLAETASA